MENDYPEIDSDPFEILVHQNWLSSGDIINCGQYEAIVIREPQTKWWHTLLFYLSFKLFQPKVTYKVKLI